jgi:hypothetical protein
MQTAKRVMIWGGIAFLAILIIGLGIAAWFGVLLTVVYIFLIILATLMSLATFMQVFMLFATLRTISTIQNESKPLIAEVQSTVGIVKDTAKTAGQTVSTVRATAGLASEFVLGPSVRTVATILGFTQMARVFFGSGKTRSRYQERRRQQQAAAAMMEEV